MEKVFVGDSSNGADESNQIIEREDERADQSREIRSRGQQLEYRFAILLLSTSIMANTVLF